MAEELKVLLIEDNQGDAFLMKFYLGESTSPVFNVFHAETVKAALDYLAENQFDMILSDMNLPDSFGVDTIKTILSKYPGNLVVVLTGLTDEAVGLETVRYGAQDFLVKGKFDGKVLISTVLFAFERFKLHKQIDNVSKQLDEENSRLESIQRLLGIGFVEYDVSTKTLFRSETAINITGSAAPDKNLAILEEAISWADNPDEMAKLVQHALENGGIGEFKYSSGGKNFRLIYEGFKGKFYGVIQLL